MALILCIAIGRICYYTLPVELPYLEEIEQCSQVKLKTFYHENWHSALENLQINEEKPPNRVAFLLN